MCRHYDTEMEKKRLHYCVDVDNKRKLLKGARVAPPLLEYLKMVIIILTYCKYFGIFIVCSI